MTENIFAAVLGRKYVKWDAFWHLLEWLLNHEEGHHLGPAFQERLLKFAFGEVRQTCEVRREYPVSGQKDGKGKWADLAVGVPDLASPRRLIVMDDIGYLGSGGTRKLRNLIAYQNESTLLHPTASIRAIVVTNAPKDVKLSVVVERELGAEAADYVCANGWKLLHLYRIGSWLREALNERSSAVPERMRLSLSDLADWCGDSSIGPVPKDD